MDELTEQISAPLEVLEEAPGPRRLFRFRGTALVQGGLSRNGRYYPPEVVAAAAAETRATPLTVYARHRDATEGSGLPVGRVDRLYLDGPALKYEVTLAPTRLGRDLQALIEEGILVSASIRASPYASRRVRLGDREVEWVEALTLKGIDFTDDPGVPEAVGFEILEEAAIRPPEEEEGMDLRSLDVETLRAERPDLVEALRAETGRLLEEVCRTLEVADAGQLPQAARELAGLRTRREIAALVDAEMAGDPLREAVKTRLLEECDTLSEARERLQRERDYAIALRRVFLTGGGPAAGAGLVENPESATLTPEQAHIRRLAGVPA